MARLIVRIKILPNDIDVDLERLRELIKEKLPDGMSIKNSRIEPIAFGLNSLLVDFAIDDKEGQMDKLEENVKSIEGVSEIQVINISREAAKL